MQILDETWKGCKIVEYEIAQAISGDPQLFFRILPLRTLPFHTGNLFRLRNQTNALARIPEDLQKEGHRSTQCDTRDSQQ